MRILAAENAKSAKDYLKWAVPKNHYLKSTRFYTFYTAKKTTRSLRALRLKSKLETHR
jgi:hypothetical protein